MSLDEFFEAYSRMKTKEMTKEFNNLSIQDRIGACKIDCVNSEKLIY